MKWFRAKLHERSQAKGTFFRGYEAALSYEDNIALPGNQQIGIQGGQRTNIRPFKIYLSLDLQ